jgi:hypothetical protein
MFTRIHHKNPDTVATKITAITKKNFVGSYFSIRKLLFQTVQATYSVCPYIEIVSIFYISEVDFSIIFSHPAATKNHKRSVCHLPGSGVSDKLAA